MFSEQTLSMLLPTMVLLPLVGAGLVLLVANWGIDWVRKMALTNVLVTFVLAAILVSAYDPQKVGPKGEPELIQMGSQSFWLGTPRPPGPDDGPAAIKAYGPDIRFSLGVDGISLWLIALTALLMIPSVLVSWEAVKDRPAAFYALMLTLESGMIGVFSAQDIILFYVFFEFTLIPLFFMIGLWGGYDRRFAARKFFIYTFAGSVLTFLGLIFIVLAHSWMFGTSHLTFSIPQLTYDIPRIVALSEPQRVFWNNVSPWIFAALFVGFAIKVPLFPFHTWLPLAHVEAPTAGSVLLAGVLLKIGSYGFLRFMLPLVPNYCVLAMDFIAILAVIGIIYGALLALAQDDIKKLVAYSSVSHMGFCLLGLFALNSVGISGGLLQMINHGLSTGALFTLVGMLYERYHTRDIEAFSGLTRKLPVMAFFFVLITFSSIGLPGLNGFTGEILALAGMFKARPVYAVLGLSGIVLGAWYMLNLVQQTFYGRLREPALDGHAGGHTAAAAHATLPAAGPSQGAHGHGGHGHGGHGHGGHGHGGHAPEPAVVGHPAIFDLNFREVAALAPIALVIVWIGLFPQFFLSKMEPSIAAVVHVLDDARAQAASDKKTAQLPAAAVSPQARFVSAPRVRQSNSSAFVKE
jgi:NADH-quinone oxidoreductase subunit M